MRSLDGTPVVDELEYSRPDNWIDKLAPPTPQHLPGSKVAKHPTRSRLLGLIRRHPGLTIQDLADMTDVERTTVQYHARKLEDARLISSRCQGRNRLHFPAGMDRSLRQAIGLMYVDSIRRLVDHLLGRPELTSSGTLADCLGVSARTVRRGLKRLKEADLLEIRREDDADIARLHPCLGAAVHWWSSIKDDT